MKWYLNRKINYYPFDISAVNTGYTKNQWKILGAGFNNTFYYYHDGYVISYRGQADLDNIIKFLRKHFNQRFVKEKGSKIRSWSVRFLAITRKAFKSKNSLKKYFNDFFSLQTELFSLFQIPEYCQLFLKTKDRKLLIRFGLTRDYAIKRIIITEKIYRTRLGKLMGLPFERALMILPNELRAYLENGKLPFGFFQRKTFCLHTIKGKARVYWNKKADQVFKKVINPRRIKTDQIKGQPAFKGRCTGRAYLAFNDNDFRKMPSGAILVCSMTRYDIVQYLKRVKAIITDQGGITCHAAIIARELRIPTIIGTQSATDVFKTGDRMEVDANKGIVRKLK